MPTITAQQIVTRAQRTLYDETGIQYPPEELLEHLSDAQRASVLHLPEINPVALVIQTDAGTRQTIPGNGFKLIDVIRNMGSSGTVPGRAIRSIDRSSLDHTASAWHELGDDVLTPIEHYSYDTRDRRGYYIYPAQPVTAGNRQRIEIVYSAAPIELLTLNAVISLDDVYQPALLSYVLHRAYAKDIPMEGVDSMQRAMAYFQQFMVTLTGQTEDDRRLHPLQKRDLEDR